MKEKIWFIFKFGDKHHQGPFSQEEIYLRRQQNNLPDNIILWKEGMKRWEPLDKCPELTIATKPSAPPTPKDTKSFLSEVPTLKSPSLSPDSYFIRLGLGISIVFFVTLLVWPKELFLKSSVSPRLLTPNKKQYLKQVAEIPSQKKILFRVAIDKNNEQLWLASNYRSEGTIFLTLKSNPVKTLSLKKIVITSQATLRQGYARFARFSLLNGNWPIPGEYQVKIALYPKSRKKKAIHWEGSFILPPKGKSSLSQSLVRWKKNIHRHYISPLKNQHQYYETLKSHLTNMEKFYKSSFRAKTWQDFSALFEQHYNREIGPLLQRFILDGRHLHLSLFNSDFENSKEYEKLFLYGKKIGALASDMLTRTGQGVIKKSEQHRISNNLLSRLKKLADQADAALESIQKKIDYYQAELPEH